MPRREPPSRPCCTPLLIAGFETTVNLIGDATVALAQDLDQWNLLRDDPARALTTP